MIPAWTLAMMEGEPEAGAAFSPTDLGPKLIAWWAPPDDGVNVTTSSGAITGWTDEVGAYVLAQATGANRPAYNATSFNGVSCAEFDASDDYLEINPAPSALPNGSTPSEIWAVVRLDADAGSDTGIRAAAAHGTSNSSTRREIDRYVSGGVNRTRAVSAGVAANNTGVDLSGYHVLRGVFGSSMRADVDGTAGSSSSISLSTDNTRFVIGTDSFLNTSRVWDGAIRQVLVTEPLSSTEAADLLAYLSQDL